MGYEEGVAEIFLKIGGELASIGIRKIDESITDAKKAEKAFYDSIESASDISFDFSDWEVKDLNSKTTSYFLGIPAGYLKMRSGMNSKKVWIPSSASEGAFVVKLYKWCRAKAGVADSQRSFRFKNGSYAGTGEWSTRATVGLAAAALLVGLLAK